MFTVIIAEKEHIEKIEEYGLFLKPFLKSGDVRFAQWDTSATTLAEMVPSLADHVGRRKEWRAVIVCNEAGIHKQNPFDLVKNLPTRFTGSIRGSGQVIKSDNALAEDQDLYAEEVDLNNIYSEEYKQYLESEHQKKLLAYEEAAENPLTRLTTFFCNTPVVTKDEDSVLRGDPDYDRYIEAYRKKQNLRKQILGDEIMEIAQPTEVICVAKRTYTSAEREFDAVWSSHTEMEYSRFYDRNMYFERMRYLVFDILPKNQRDYTFDYIRFLYATILLASNHIPSGCLAAERVYKLECENDEKALSNLLQTYEAKLNLTKESLNLRIQQIQEKKPHVLRDNEAQRLFCAKVDLPVLFDESFFEEELYAKTKDYGLADGCPNNEELHWEGQYHHSQKTLGNMLKQSRRSLRRASARVREQEDVSFSRVELLNEFQLEDIQDFTDAQELEMLNTDITNLYEEEKMYAELAEQDVQVKDKIRQRMFKSTTLALGGCMCLLFLLSFITVFLKNSTSRPLKFAGSLAFAGIGVGAFVLVAVVALFFLRSGLTQRIKDFNGTMHGISNRVYRAMAAYSKYLSHMCNVRRGYAVLNAVERKDNPDQDKIILLKKHIEDIEKARAEVRDVFGQFMVEKMPVQESWMSGYDFNYDVPAEYKYPLPYADGTIRKITFIQAGVYAEVPVEFVKQIMVRREELYE